MEEGANQLGFIMLSEVEEGKSEAEFRLQIVTESRSNFAAHRRLGRTQCSERYMGGPLCRTLPSN